MRNHLLSALQIAQKCNHGRLWYIISVQEGCCLVGGFFSIYEILFCVTGTDTYNLVLYFTAAEINC